MGHVTDEVVGHIPIAARVHIARRHLGNGGLLGPILLDAGSVLGHPKGWGVGVDRRDGDQEARVGCENPITHRDVEYMVTGLTKLLAVPHCYYT